MSVASGLGAVPGGSMAAHFPIFGLEGDRGLAAPAFCGMLAFTVIACLVGRDAEEPRLELALPMKCIQVSDDGQEHLLADLLGILAREVVPELEDEPPRSRIVSVEPRSTPPPYRSGRERATLLRSQDPCRLRLYFSPWRLNSRDRLAWAGPALMGPSAAWPGIAVRLPMAGHPARPWVAEAGVCSAGARWSGVSP